MIHRILYYFFICALPFTIDASSPPLVSESLQNPYETFKDSRWRGILDLGACKLTIEFHVTFKPEKGVFESELTCFEQQFENIPVTSTQIEDSKFSLQLTDWRLDFQGIIHSNSTIEGTFTQYGKAFPLKLKIVDEFTPIIENLYYRPQEPKPPFPYFVEEVNILNEIDEVDLSATLTIPTANKPSPAVILIPGSGPVDRNQEVVGHKPFLVLADHLTKEGIAVLRFDKRGAGDSEGDYYGATYEDYAQDILSCLNYLKNREDIDPHQIGLIGHSEGGLIAPLAASKSEDIAFLVLLGAPAVNGETTIIEQAQALFEAEYSDKSVIELCSKLQKNMIEILLNFDSTEAPPKLNALIDDHIKNFPVEDHELLKIQMSQTFDEVNKNRHRTLLGYDPREALEQIRVPLLALYGELDKMVSPSVNIPSLETILENNNLNHYEVVTLPKHNHLFQVAELGTPSEYAKIEETISMKALNKISNWILDVTGEIGNPN